VLPKGQYVRKLRELQATTAALEAAFAHLAETYAALPPPVDPEVLRTHLRALLRARVLVLRRETRRAATTRGPAARDHGVA